MVELGGEFLGGDVLQWGVGNDATCVDDDGTGAHGFDFLHDVGGEEDHFVLADIAHEGVDLFELVGVKAGGGFVEDKDLGVVDQCLGKTYALAIAF